MSSSTQPWPLHQVSSQPVSTGLSALDVADLLLVEATRRRSVAVLLEPGDGDHSVVLDAGGQVSRAYLSAALGDAVVARIALIAGVDLAAPQSQVGRIRLRAGDREAQYMVLINVATEGLGVEIRRVMDAGDLGRPPAEDEAADERGSRFGVYRLVRERGRGAMGRVYEAEHNVLGKRVAIKVLHPESARDPAVAARFVREARAASRAQHPGILDVTDFGALPDGRAFLVMELCEWPTLDALLADGALPAARAVIIARRIAAALEAAHAVGVVHRDLKPANVFVAADDHVKIGDFGSAKVIGMAASPGDTQAGAFCGTPYYMSPEQAGGDPTDRRTDIYALGCTLFQMLSGHVPYEGDTSLAVITGHVAGPVPRLTSPHGTLPEILHRVIARSMAKQVEERYPTAAEMAADLSRATSAFDRSGWRRWLSA